MCGITGIFRLQDRAPIDVNLLHRMNDAQSHRGPDGHGIHLEPGVGLGHRRLSIIDLATGQQPLYNEDESVVIVFNGEVYNYQELVPQLQAAGHTFHTRSDTEVIVHAWEQWGAACVDKLRGMFTFVIWDRNRQQLFMARDRLGVKPFYYSLTPNGDFIFASELKALQQHPQLPRRMNPKAVEEYFALGYVPEPRTIFHDVFKLEPGHCMTLQHGRPLPAPHKYWDAPFAPVPVTSEAALLDELHARLAESIRLRMIAEVPLGAFLSGGVDSSAVVALMAEQSHTPVKTCSIAFDVAKYDESAYAQQVAQQYRTEHYVERVATDDFALLDRLAGFYDEPYADSSALPTYRVCELARKHVTVALSGDGGDESFAGYRRYRFHMHEERVRSMLPLGMRRAIFGPLAQLYPKADWAPRFLRAKSTFQGMSFDSVQAYFNAISIVRDPARRSLFSDKLTQELQGYNALEVFRRHAANAPTEDPLSLIQYLDLKTYLVGDINTKVDRASMANSLEVREPLMDHTLVEWLSGLPRDFMLRGGEGKYLLKKAMEPHLPHDILYRQKQGFAVPLTEWFRGPLAQKVRAAALSESLLDCGYFNRTTIETLLSEHQSGLRDHSAPLWTLLMFDGFLKTSQGISA
ncbi:MAG: amidotransferase 1, exosortase A system-associated [Burkholderiaceae bacterium]|nr:MAG: amidotransferase 1, exosortase A system-associated [Burkholderiaceae bacterium]